MAHRTYDDLRRKINKGHSRSGPWWWVSATILTKRTGTARNALLGPYNSEEEGWQKGYELCESNFEVIPFQTRDTNEANRMNRMRLANQGRSLGEVVERVRHRGRDIGVE